MGAAGQPHTPTTSSNGSYVCISQGYGEARKARLLLQDGVAFDGLSFGAEGNSVTGECVFATGMVGYVESLTDPSYQGQILVLTYPLIGNYGVPAPGNEETFPGIPEHFESSKIHVAGLVVAFYSEFYSHYLAHSSLGKWLKQSGVPAICGVDTRAITKRIRDEGSMLAKLLLMPGDGHGEGDSAVVPPPEIEWRDPNKENLVAMVSTAKPVLYEPIAERFEIRRKANGKPFRILAIDVGLKYNQLRCFLRRGVEVFLVPWDYEWEREEFDGLFISNGPGDPNHLGDETVVRLRNYFSEERGIKPTLGICLGHQLIALAAGARTTKMKFGNRGQNIPCIDQTTGQCYITTQNHGFAVDASTLPSDWAEFFINANDLSNEGIYHTRLPIFSVQFHPEASAGPKDTEFLFDRFLENVAVFARTDSPEDLKKRTPFTMGDLSVSPPSRKQVVDKRTYLRKVLILGSGGLSIGQAGEFDYSGSQAIKALKEEGIYTVLINPNIATIQTSPGLADKVYFLPVTPEFVRKVIEFEKPDGIYVTFGGQTALNVGVKLKDEFQKLGVEVLGTPIRAIMETEDREVFANQVREIGARCAQSAAATSVEEALDEAAKIGYPVILRAAYALGGLGSGFADNSGQLTKLAKTALSASPQVLIERSMKGWKEIEYEVVRDAYDNCITVCNMENFDPLGIHTGDSIVVAPSQTLSDDDYHMLRKTALKVIRRFGVVGECNIQYALNPSKREYCIIEVNARLSRSSALASKATGYPLAYVAAKLGLGIPLSEIKNSVTKETTSCFEPSLDYCVVKIPRWDLVKFSRVSRSLSSAMKSVGEVMAIGRTFEETIQKAIRAVNHQFQGFTANEVDIEDIDYELTHPSDRRLFAIANAMHAGYATHKIWEMTKIDLWFLERLKAIVETERAMVQQSGLSKASPSLITKAKQLGFSDRQIAKCFGSSEMAVRKMRGESNITPFVKQIDTVAAEFPAFTNYLYMTYCGSEHDVTFEDQGITVLGSGVYRIGSSVEFDWCAVRSIRTLREHGFQTIMINYNPETVSTDYDEADRLYFEDITLERVLDIYELEKSQGVIISMGGQMPNNIAMPLHRYGVNILGTKPDMIDQAENRYKFSRMLDKILVDQPRWKELTSHEDATRFCEQVGYPVLVRPSYVLSGAAMNVVFTTDDLSNYLSQAVAVSREFPVVISKFIEDAKEIEMDAVARDGELVFQVISEHIENAGVHSGDATLIQPPQDLDPETVKKIITATALIGKNLNVTGPYNIQFIAKNNEIKVIECNLRASRSFPFVSKVVGVDLVELSTKVMMGLPVDVKAPTLPPNYVCVKVPQFSFSRLSGADPVLGVEMASTGEVACFGRDRFEAYLKGLLATGFKLPKENILLSIGSYKAKQEFLPSIKRLHQLGYVLFATAGTADYCSEHGIPVKALEVLDDHHSEVKMKDEYSLQHHLTRNVIELYINLPSNNKYRRPASYMSRGYRSRRLAVDFSIPLITNIKCAKLFVEALSRIGDIKVRNIDWKSAYQTIQLPGLINVHAMVSGDDWMSSVASMSKACLKGGITVTTLTVDQTGDERHVAKILDVCRKRSYVDFALAIKKMGVKEIREAEITNEVIASGDMVFVAANEKEHLTRLVSEIPSWPSSEVRIITAASGTYLGSILFIASLTERSIHVTNINSVEDLKVIKLSKSKGLSVTCDVRVSALLDEDMWQYLDVIDCFSVDSLDAEVAIPLLLTFVSQQKIALEDIVNKMYNAPRQIFKIQEQADTWVEVELNRPWRAKALARLPERFQKLQVVGSVHRVAIRGVTKYLDGDVVGEAQGSHLSREIHPAKAVVGSPVTQPLSPVQAPAGPVVGSGPLSPTVLATSPQTQTLSSVIAEPALSPRQQSTRAVVSSLNQDFTPIGPPMRGSSTILGLNESFVSKMRSLSASNPLFSRTAFTHQHILDSRQFSRNDLHILFGIAGEMRILVEKQGFGRLLEGKVLCTAFFEPSTRTRLSFEAAWTRLGGSVIGSVEPTTSSVAKGESLEDTVVTLSQYADCIVLRHPKPGSAQQAAKVCKVPIINGGDGIGEHPTQAFLDVFTIREELGTVNGLTITLAGDLKNGRTVHSLVRLLSMYDVKLNYVSPPELRMPETVTSEVKVRQTHYESLESVISTTDVLYVTRIQAERLANPEEAKKYSDTYKVDLALLRKAKNKMVILHPLPRRSEIDVEVDFDARAAYFRQMRYGMFVRMALLTLVMGKTW